MTHNEARELLDRAASAVTPAETDPATRLSELGRRSVRRRRGWGAAGAAAVAVAAVVAVPLGILGPGRTPDAAAPGPVSFGDVTVDVPQGWQVSRVPVFTPCDTEEKTVYLAPRWDLFGGMRNSNAPGTRFTCEPAATWMAVVEKGDGRVYSSPDRLVAAGGALLQAEPLGGPGMDAVRQYVPFDNRPRASAVFVAGDQDELLGRVTWPAAPPAPPSGGLALPRSANIAQSDVLPSNGMQIAQDAATINEIRSRLAELRDPVPAGEECVLQRPGSIGIALDEVAVVLGDETCPQAISSGGGRVRVPAGLGKELQDLIVASDRARSERDQQKKD